MKCNSEPINMIIDTDPGVDDIIALLLAFRTEKVNIKSICLTHGNTNLSNVMRNLCSLFHILTLQHQHDLKQDKNAKDLFFKKELPRVAIGATKPLKGECFAAEDVHGSDGIGNLTNTHPHFIDNEFQSKLSSELAYEKQNSDAGIRFKVSEYDAVDEILYQLKSNPPFTITLVTLGPLTNLAMAYQKDPITLSKVKNIFIMGGACRVPGNVTTEAEFNFFADGYAAKIIMDSTKGFNQQDYLTRINNKSYNNEQIVPLPITIVPLDITMSTYLLRTTLDNKIGNQQHQPLASFFKNILNTIIEWSLKYEKVDGVGLHDPLCMAVAIGLIQPKMKYEDVHVEFEHQHSVGKCIIKTELVESEVVSKESNVVNVCYAFDQPDEFQYQMINLIFGD